MKDILILAKDLNAYEKCIDKFGLIGQVQQDGSIDGGDALCWNAHHAYLTNGDYQFLEHFEVAPGAYVRHPFDGATPFAFGSYYKHPWDGCVSRDQLTGLIGGLIASGDRWALVRVIAHHAAWGFLFAYNTVRNGENPTTHWKWPDLTGPDIWAMELRGFGLWSWLFWPLLCVLDIHNLINTLVVNRIYDNDCISYLMKLMVSLDHVPTPTSWLADKLLNREYVYLKLVAYWAGWRDQIEFIELYDKKIALKRGN